MKRDYVGAKTILKYSKDHDETDENMKDLWMAFCNFHLGDYKTSMDQYEKMYEKNKDVKEIALNLGVCMFYLGMYEDAQKMIEDLPESPLKVFEIDIKMRFKPMPIFITDSSLIPFGSQVGGR